jgi:hypothetical protein
MIDALVERVVSHWRRIGIVPVEPLSRQDIAAAETRIGSQIPDDLLALYLRANGMRAGDYDDRNVRFWQIEELAQYISADASGITYGGFADFLLMSHVYEVRLNKSLPTEVRIEAALPVVVASSFTEFLRLYLDEPWRLYIVSP